MHINILFNLEVFWKHFCSSVLEAFSAEHCLQHWFFKDDSIPPMNTVGSFKSANCRATLIPVLQKVFDSAQLAVSNQVQQAKYVFLMFVVYFVVTFDTWLLGSQLSELWCMVSEVSLFLTVVLTSQLNLRNVVFLRAPSNLKLNCLIWNFYGCVFL